MGSYERGETPHPGFELAKTLKLGGCILVLIISIAGTALLLKGGIDPLEGYEPPQSVEYYGQHLPELKAELEANVLPRLTGVESCEINGGRLTVVLTGADYAVQRAALLRHFDASLFDFVTP